MILVLGSGPSSAPFSAALPYSHSRTSPCVINWRFCNDQSVAPAPTPGPDLLGRASQLWAGWWASLVIVKPATVLARHRQGFQLTGAGSPGDAQWVAASRS